ncbi:hypothetical protein ACFQV2_29320 [Actinokineospora soli]|uniref:Uncharacterized protein n=1 Tax=Actinokineospora soli TaxID=1048753 RepID=A0ABW2TVX8_9PSEU
MLGSLSGQYAVAVLAGVAVVAAGLAVREVLALGSVRLAVVTGSVVPASRTPASGDDDSGEAVAPPQVVDQDEPADPRRAGTFWTVLGATAASGAAGAGVAPVAALTGIVGEPVEPHPVAVLVAVVVPVVLALVAVGRRDVAGGLVVAGALAVPPVGLLQGGSAVPAVALGGVVLVAGLALWRSRWVSSDGLLAGLGGGAVALAVYGVPALAVPGLVRAGVTLALLLGALVLAWRLPAYWGGPLAGIGLAGIAVAGPWQRLGLVSGDPALTVVALAAFSAVGLVVSAAVITALWLRHGHAGTAAGGALLLLHDLAWLLNTLGGDFASGPAPLPAVVGPLVLLALARPALPVVVAATGFTLAAMTARTFVDAELRIEALRIAPLTPTDVLLTAQLPDNPAWVVPLLLVGLLGARTVAAPVVVLFGTQALLVALG